LDVSIFAKFDWLLGKINKTTQNKGRFQQFFDYGTDKEGSFKVNVVIK
jgi:hypothetical protein